MGRFMRLGAGREGGAMRAVEAERFVSAEVFEDVMIAVVVSCESVGVE